MSFLAPPDEPIDIPRLRLSGPPDIVLAVPYLLGFHPEDSLVLVGLTGERQRVGLHMRVDLGQVRDEPAALKHLSTTLARSGADAAVAVLYPSRGTEGLPDVGLIDDLRLALEDERLQLLDALCVRDGRWWSYDCCTDSCCPADGTEITDPSSSRMAAAATFAGIPAPKASREDVVASLRPVTGVAFQALEDAVRRVDEEFALRLSQGLSVEDFRREVGELVEGVVTSGDGQSGQPSAGDCLPIDDVARILVGLVDVHVRDALLRWSLPPHAERAETLWRDLTRRAPQDLVAPPATLLAITAMCVGDGVVANVALDRALEADPGYALARLIFDAARSGLPPEAIREVCRQAWPLAGNEVPLRRIKRPKMSSGAAKKWPGR